jgi:hypothetical protein
VDKEEGIFNSHILMLIINKIVALQRRVQLNTIKRGKRNWSKLIGISEKHMQNMTNFLTGMGGGREITEKLTALKTKLRDYTDNMQQAKHISTDNFYINNMGKNKAASFMVSKETTRSLHILRDNDNEITDKDETLNRLHDNIFSTVGKEFILAGTWENFLGENGVVLPDLTEEDYDHME